MIEIIKKNNYQTEKARIYKLIDEIYYNDNSTIANTKETCEHLDFIFSQNNNEAFLLLNLRDNKLICMVNFLEFNNVLKEWSLFSIFTKPEYRNQGLASEIVKLGIEEVKKLNGTKVLSGIEPDNIKSQTLHTSIGFKYEGKMWDDYAPGFPENHLGYILEIR